MSPKKLILIFPIYNEEAQLESSMRQLFEYSTNNLADYDWSILIGDNGSSDRSPEIYHRLANENQRYTFVRIEEKGRGLMLKKLWLDLDFDICIYMDLDLSTDLKHIRPMVEAIAKNGYQIAIGSRLHPKAKVVNRPLTREIVSRSNVQLLRLIFNSKITDFNCGFKAISRKAAKLLVPKIQSKYWFFDAELLIIAEKNKFPIFEEPVYWTHDPGSTFRLFRDISRSIRDIYSLQVRKPWKSLQEYPVIAEE